MAAFGVPIDAANHANQAYCVMHCLFIHSFLITFSTPRRTESSLPILWIQGFTHIAHIKCIIRPLGGLVRFVHLFRYLSIAPLFCLLESTFLIFSSLHCCPCYRPHNHVIYVDIVYFRAHNTKQCDSLDPSRDLATLATSREG